jgi:hypothetical protein
MQPKYEKVTFFWFFLLLIAGNDCCFCANKSWAEDLHLESEPELQLQVRPVEQFPPVSPVSPVSPVKPTAQFKPIGELKANVSYFQTSNIFSATDGPIQDSLALTGLTLGSVDVPLGHKTFANISIDGNLIRYLNQSKYDYNQLGVNFSLYRLLSPHMYGAISAKNQQLFYVNSSNSFHAGDRFLNENSFKLSLGRRDALTKKIALDTLYEFSVKIDDPSDRSRLVNYLLISLSYYLRKPLQVGIDYEFNLADFTQLSREDLYNRIFGHLNYNLSKTSNVNIQAGVSLGGSNDPTIDYNGWFLSVNYSLQIGQF